MKQVVTFGEIMLRLSPPGYLRFSQTNQFDVVYGGGESNVAVSLANYGIPVHFITRLPENSIPVGPGTSPTLYNSSFCTQVPCHITTHKAGWNFP